MKSITLIVLVAFAMLIGACRDYYSTFEVINGGREPITDVVISDRKTSWEMGAAGPGEILSFSEHLHGEGSFFVSWTIDGKRYRARGCYYTGGYPARGKVIIEGKDIKYGCM
ncbi:hypothetical protein [Stakelama tenebrarum]|uniref:Lipoprotein n=1 Tax=Stakelama tenebrarum TaxID=2711215 RepID=A0A6G6Y3D6_9SPHN|nr:hypothetical protein [Sphingosinithalassobacter tenebrarum]QIG79442.1 hypothetical protein G5C33_06335 [Sphingosinithalassobacter tenebrarum]